MATPNPNPVDPLDDLITLFKAEVDSFLTLNSEITDPPEKEDTGNRWDDVERFVAALMGKAHEAMVAIQPEIDRRLARIIDIGHDIVELTDDPNISDPVNRVVKLASERRLIIEKLTPLVGEATTIPRTVALFLVGLLFGSAAAAQIKEIERQLDSLITYYMMRGFPPDTAA